MGPLVNDKVERLDDGTPLRPFDNTGADEQKVSRSKAMSKVAIGLALLGGVVKQFFVAEANEGRSPSGPDGRSKPALDLVVSREIPQTGEKLPPTTPAVDGEMHGNDAEIFKFLSAPLPRATFTFDYAANANDLQLLPTPALPQNDNETLYAFTPGIGITLPSTEAGRSGFPAGGSGGGTKSKPKPPDPQGRDDNGNADADGGDGTSSQDDETTDPPDGPVNQRPTVSGPVRLQPQYVNMSVIISMSALLKGAADADGDELDVVNLTASAGSLTAHGPGTWLYTPDRGSIATVQFTYDVSDHSLSVAQSAVLQFVDAPPVQIAGTDGDDIVLGTPSADTINTLDGDDDVLGREGDDTIYGRGGNDRIVGGDGDDVIFGHEGDDQIFAGSGDDVVFAGTGDDIIQGDAGNDVMFGEDDDDTFTATEDDGNDFIDGGEGLDTYSASAITTPIDVNLAEMKASGDQIGDDTLINIENVVGGGGDDRIVGSSEANELNGSDGDDLLSGGAGGDMLSGGQGDDIFVASHNDGHDVIDGGDGADAYDASTSQAGVTIDLQGSEAFGDEIGQDAIVSIENAIGGGGNDTLVASDAVNILTGGGGGDIFVFEASTAGYGNDFRDKITDFEVGDRINVKALGEQTADSLEDLGFKKFILISQGAEFTEPGQIRFRYESLEDGEVTVIEGNIDDDFATHEFEIELQGYYELSNSDFYGDEDNSGPG